MGPKTCQHCVVLNLHCIPLCLFSKTFLILYLYEMTAVHQHFCGHHFMMYANQIIMLYTLSVYSAVMSIIFQWNWRREAGRPYCPTLTLSRSGVWPSLRVSVAQLCLTLCDPMDCSPPGSSVHFPDKSTGVGCYFLFQGIFPNQGSNPSLLHCSQTLYRLSHLHL